MGTAALLARPQGAPLQTYPLGVSALTPPPAGQPSLDFSKPSNSGYLVLFKFSMGA